MMWNPDKINIASRTVKPLGGAYIYEFCPDFSCTETHPTHPNYSTHLHTSIILYAHIIQSSDIIHININSITTVYWSYTYFILNHFQPQHEPQILISFTCFLQFSTNYIVQFIIHHVNHMRTSKPMSNTITPLSVTKTDKTGNTAYAAW